MSEKEMYFIKVLKRWVIGLASTVVLSIAGAVFVSWQAAIINTTKMETLEKTQEFQKILIDEKANMKSVLAIKETLEQKIVDKFDIIDGKLDVMMKLSPTYNYYDNSQTKIK